MTTTMSIKRWGAAVALVGLVSGIAPATAQAQAKQVVGWSSIATGITLMFAAYDYTEARCPANASVYTTYVGGQRETTCVVTYRGGGGSVYSPNEGGIQGTATLARPGLITAGVGATIFGAVVLLLPAKARKAAPDVSITATGITATKTLRF